MVDTRAINLGVFGDPAHMLVTAAEPSNVDTVVVDGRILKRHGKLTAFDVEADRRRGRRRQCRVAQARQLVVNFRREALSECTRIRGRTR